MPDAPPRPTEVQLRDLLRGVVDPELGADIVDMGMVRRIRLADDGSATVTVALTSAGCPLRGQIMRDIKARLVSVPGVSSVHLDWDEMTPEEKSVAMSRARLHAAENAPGTAVPLRTKIIAIASGKGGVGKSSVTVNLAAALAARGFTVGVLDADITGFSVPRLLGVAGRLAGAGDGKIAPTSVPVGAGVLEVVSMGLLAEHEDDALMWRGLMQNRALQHFVEDVDWGDLDYLVIDLPPGTGDVQMGMARMLPRAEVIIVTTPALAAQKVAARAADLARKSFLRIVGVVENMSAFTCDHGETYALFGSGGGQALADELGTPLLASIPLEPAVGAGGDAGEPVALRPGHAGDAFRALADRIVDEAVPPAELAGCTARMFERVEAALAAQG